MGTFLNSFLFTAGGAPSGYVDSIQEVEITFSGVDGASKTATISSVNTSRTFIIPAGNNGASGGGWDDISCGLELTNSTTVTAYRYSTGASGVDVTVRCYVVEASADLVSSVQYGSIVFSTSDSTSKTATISSVTTSNSIIIDLGTKTTYTGAIAAHTYNGGWWSFDNSTTINCTRGATSGSQTVTKYYCVVAFNASAIASIQEVNFSVATASGTGVGATISSVDLDRTALFYGGFSTSRADDDSMCAFEMINSTTASMSWGIDQDQSFNGTLWIVEFDSGVLTNNARLAFNLTTETSVTAGSFGPVTIANSTVSHLGQINSSTSGSIIHCWMLVDLGSTTQTTVSRAGANTINGIIYHQVLEWSMT